VSTEPGVGGILLAAGAGTRFGGPKALATIAGERFVERGRRILAAGGCDPVIVVLGAAAAEIRGAADLHGAEAVNNPDWASGMGSSLRAGLDALEGRCAAAVVALADQPRVGEEAIHRLIAAWRSGAIAAVATYAGQPRNPVVLDASLWPAAREAAVGDTGARGLLRTLEGVKHVPCDDTGSPDDVDTTAELARLSELTRHSPAARPDTEEQPCS
jgi:CTP:molybdopterin cytidylyltransferase MocA